MTPILEIKGFGKRYGELRAVDNLSLTIAPGDIFGFIGKNGAGKTTTLRAIAGILHFEEGQILVDGLDVQRQPVDTKRKIAYIPDNPDLYEFLTGRQYLYFISDLFQLTKAEREERIADLARQLDLEGRIDDLVSSYSHGMKQKLAMMGGFLHRPQLFLMDEPFVGLDPEAVVRVREMIKDFCRQGSAVFFSTHVLEVAQRLCNKVAILQQGRLVAAGDMQEMVAGGTLESAFLKAVQDA